MRSSIPTTNLRQLHRVARAALQQYSLRDVRLKLVGDIHNIVFRVTARPPRARQQKQFALRLHMKDWLSDAMIESEMSWLEALRRDTALLVPNPVRNEAHELLTAASDGSAQQRTCTLLDWAPGRIYWKRPSATWLRKIGRLMAQLQDYGARYARPVGFRRPRWDAAAMTGRKGILKESWEYLPKRALSVFTDVCDRFSEAAREIGSGAENFGLIHADLHVANVLSNRGRPVAIDFDDCCDGYYLFDLAAAIDLLEFRDNYRELRAAFLAGYYDVRPQATAHDFHINTFLAARFVMVGLYLARQSDKQRQLKRVLDIIIPKLKRFLRAPESLGGGT